MIGKEELNEEEPILKVLDKRKFNSDGSVREGVQLEVERPKQQPETAVPINEPTDETVQTNESTPPVADEKTFTETDENDEFDASDIPGADDPASFVNFLSTLASQAAAALGAMPHPVTGQRTLDLETGKYWIDVLAMLKEKTRNNLHTKESELFDGILSDLQMQFVQVSRIAEEKLKQQAAQKFSAQDILGKK